MADNGTSKRLIENETIISFFIIDPYNDIRMY
jgi:hypothetical protein